MWAIKELKLNIFTIYSFVSWTKKTLNISNNLNIVWQQFYWNKFLIRVVVDFNELILDRQLVEGSGRLWCATSPLSPSRKIITPNLNFKAPPATQNPHHFGLEKHFFALCFVHDDMHTVQGIIKYIYLK